MTHPLVILTYVVGAGELFLALYFLKTNSGATIRKVMSLLCASTAVWVLASALVAYKSETVLIHTVNSLIFVTGLLLLTSLVWLVLIYPYPSYRIDNLHVILLFVPVIIFTAIILTTKTVVVAIDANITKVGSLIPGPVYPIYNLYQIGLYLVSVSILVIKSRHFSGYYKRNILIILACLILGGLPGVFVDLIAPFFNLYNVNFLYGNLASVFWLGGVTYILVEKNVERQ